MARQKKKEEAERQAKYAKHPLHKNKDEYLRYLLTNTRLTVAQATEVLDCFIEERDLSENDRLSLYNTSWRLEKNRNKTEVNSLPYIIRWKGISLAQSESKPKPMPSPASPTTTTTQTRIESVAKPTKPNSSRQKRAAPSRSPSPQPKRFAGENANDEDEDITMDKKRYWWYLTNYGDEVGEPIITDLLRSDYPTKELLKTHLRSLSIDALKKKYGGGPSHGKRKVDIVAKCLKILQ